MSNLQERINLLYRKAQDFGIRAWNRTRGSLPIPPADLVFLAAGSDDVSWFLKAGAMAAQSMVEILEKHGLSMRRPFRNSA
jgi:hypothetical protein